MALISPGVQVTIIDESNYIPAATNSVPYFLIATAQDKVSGSGVGVARGTLASEANKPFLITSQRDLTQTFGNPFFYKTTVGTPINGYELNEYGLLAAYSALGVTNRAYVQRVDIDLTELTASLVRPTGAPDNGAFWINTASTLWGLFEWNQTTGAFTNKVPAVITDPANLTGNVPKSSFGNIGDYAINATGEIYYGCYKNASNTWVVIGSDAWKASWPTVQGTNTVTGTLTSGWIIDINNIQVPVPSTPDNDLDGLVDAINNASIQGVTAANVNNKLVLYADSSASNDGSTGDGDGIIYIDEGSTSGLLTALGISSGLYYAPELQQSPNYTVPRWRSTDNSPRPTGSVWQKTNAPNLGANISVLKYSSTLDSWIQQPCPMYPNNSSANEALDPSGGGKNITAGSTIAIYNTIPEQNPTTLAYHPTATFEFYERYASGASVFTGTTVNPTFTPGQQVAIQTSIPGTAALTVAAIVTIGGTGTVSDFLTAVSAANIPDVVVSVNAAGNIVWTQTNGGVILLRNLSGGTVLEDAGINSSMFGARLTYLGSFILSYWINFDHTASATAPTVDPADGRLWYYSAVNQADIMINNAGTWVGYQNETNDVRGYNLSLTNPTGPIIAASAPSTQTDGTSLIYGDLWIDTGDLESYPKIYRWESVDSVDQWVLIDNTDQTTENGILFADARWSSTGTVDPITGNLPTIASLLTSNYLDVDAPDATLYPDGMLLFNTRRSGYNVKAFRTNYFNAADFSYSNWNSGVQYAVGDQVLYGTTLYVAIVTPSVGTLPTNTSFWSPLETNSWVTVSGNKANGSPYMGRQAQRALIVAALKAGIDSSTDIREEQRDFNLQACPGYPELIPNMLALNNDRNGTSFVVGDTPLRLGATGNEILNWVTNNNGNGVATGDGLTVSSEYVGVFYPSCQTTDLSGSAVVQPPSHMMVRTIIRNDEVAYPWLAPAGTRRGVIDNADNIGYINADTGEFVSLGVNQGLRDVLYENKINPITFVPGVGITNFGNKTLYGITSSLDRINVARLVAFLRGRLQSIGKNFLFEPNDQITRNEITNAVNSLMIDLVAKRGIYDFLVVCDETNNTPARIDANELWIDIAIEPVKAVEFIYIPVRLKNTGEIAAGTIASAQGV